MKTLTNRIFDTMFDIEHILTPIAIEHLFTGPASSQTTYKIIYVIGVRVAYITTVGNE